MQIVNLAFLSRARPALVAYQNHSVLARVFFWDAAAGLELGTFYTTSNDWPIIFSWPLLVDDKLKAFDKFGYYSIQPYDMKNKSVSHQNDNGAITRA